MAKTGSAIIFWHEDWSKCPHDPSLSVSFVQAMDLNKIFPRPGGIVKELSVCQVEVEKQLRDCLVLTIEPERSLGEQFEIVAKDKKYLEMRGVRWMAEATPSANGASADRPQPNPIVNIVNIPPLQLFHHQMANVQVEVPKSAPVQPVDLSPPRNALAASNFVNILPKQDPVTVKATPVKATTKPRQPRITKKLAGSKFAPVRGVKPVPPIRSRRSSSGVNYAAMEGLGTDDEDEEGSSDTRPNYSRASMPASRARAETLAPPVARAASESRTTKVPTKRVSFDLNTRGFEPVANKTVFNAKGHRTDTHTLTSYIVTNAKTVKKAVELAVEELFTNDEVINGVFTERAMRRLPPDEQATSAVLDENKMGVLFDAVTRWKQAKYGFHAIASKLSLEGSIREMKKELRLEALGGLGQVQGSVKKSKA